jgi:hypothetical protein
MVRETTYSRYAFRHEKLRKKLLLLANAIRATLLIIFGYMWITCTRSICNRKIPDWNLYS